MFDPPQFYAFPRKVNSVGLKCQEKRVDHGLDLETIARVWQPKTECNNVQGAASDEE